MMRSSAELLSMRRRRALITGAASGIGKAMALRFAEARADLMLLDRDEAGLTLIADEARAYAVQVSTYVVDLEHKSQIDVFWGQADLAVPDILINNAGSYPMREFLELDPGFLSRTLRVNLESALWMCQGFIARRMGTKGARKGGVIINVSSVEALAPLRDDLIPYSVSKAGILALTRALAHAYGREGFRVNVLVPGAIKTPGTARLAKAAALRLNIDLMQTGYLFEKRLALGRWGEPDEVARVALFLASDLASYVQGAAIPVDGGFLSS